MIFFVVLCMYIVHIKQYIPNIKAHMYHVPISI